MLLNLNPRFSFWIYQQLLGAIISTALACTMLIVKQRWWAWKGKKTGSFACSIIEQGWHVCKWWAHVRLPWTNTKATRFPEWTFSWLSAVLRPNGYLKGMFWWYSDNTSQHLSQCVDQRGVTCVGLTHIWHCFFCCCCCFPPPQDTALSMSFIMSRDHVLLEVSQFSCKGQYSTKDKASVWLCAPRP